MIIEFRNSDGSAFERQALGGPKMEYASTTAGREARMIALGCPADLAKRAAARQVRSVSSAPALCDLDAVRDMVNRQRAEEFGKIIAADQGK